MYIGCCIGMRSVSAKEVSRAYLSVLTPGTNSLFRQLEKESGAVYGMLTLFLGVCCEMRFSVMCEVQICSLRPPQTFTLWGLVGAVMWFLSPEHRAGEVWFYYLEGVLWRS
jgi:hypothetical protein